MIALTKLKRLVGILAILATAFISSAVAQQNEAGSPSWLIVVQGDVAGVGSGTIALAAAQRAIAFSDRPDRFVRIIDLETFVATAWDEGGDFRIDPPNASLIDEANDTIGVIEIEAASFDGAALTMSFTLLEGALPAPGDHIALTIDMDSNNAIDLFGPR